MYNLHTKKTWIRYGNGTHDNHTYKKVGWCQVTKKKKKSWLKKQDLRVNIFYRYPCATRRLENRYGRYCLLAKWHQLQLRSLLQGFCKLNTSNIYIFIYIFFTANTVLYSTGSNGLGWKANLEEPHCLHGKIQKLSHEFLSQGNRL